MRASSGLVGLVFLGAGACEGGQPLGAGEHQDGLADFYAGVDGGAEVHVKQAGWQSEPLTRVGANAGVGVHAPTILNENFETLRDPFSFNRWYSYPVVGSDVACDVTYEAGAYSRAGCLAWLDRQPWGEIGKPGGFLRSRAPWWVDPNHRIALPAYDPASLPNFDPGIGYIHVIGFVQPRASEHRPIDLSNGEVQFRIRVGEDFSTLLAPSRVGERPGHVYFWFQTAERPLGSDCRPNEAIGENCTRQSDYILADHDLIDPEFELDTRGVAGSWTEVTLSLPIDESRWTCLGRGENVKYDCLPIQDALKQISLLGFVMAPVCTAPTPQNVDAAYTCAPAGTLPDVTSAEGSVDIDDLVVSAPEELSVLWNRANAMPVKGTKKKPAPFAFRELADQHVVGSRAELEITVGPGSESRLLGLAAHGTTAQGELNVGMRLGANQVLSFYEQGVMFAPSGGAITVSEGDTLRVVATRAESGLLIEYYRNDVEIRVSALLADDCPKTPRFQPMAMRSNLLLALDRTVIKALHRNLASALRWTELDPDITSRAGAVSQATAVPGRAISTEHLTSRGGNLDFNVGGVRDISTISLVGTEPAPCAELGYGVSFASGIAKVMQCGQLVAISKRPYTVKDRFRISMGTNAEQQPMVRFYVDSGAGFVFWYETGVLDSEATAIRVTLAKQKSAFKNVTVQDARTAIVWDPATADGVALAPSLVRTRAGYGWIAGVASRHQLPVGDGFVEARVRDNLSGKRFGLSHGDTDAGYEDIDYQFYLPDVRWRDDTNIYKYENSAQVGIARSAGGYAAGDRFRVGVEGGKITYRRNGELLFQEPTVLPASAYPLIVDTSLYSQGAELYEVTLSGNFVSLD